MSISPEKGEAAIISTSISLFFSWLDRSVTYVRARECLTLLGHSV